MRGLFFGLTTVDLQFLVQEYPESNSKTKAEKNGIYAGGPATNAAIGYSYAGGLAQLYTVIGIHSFRDFIINDVQNAGVEIIDLIPGKKSEPVFASIITSKKSGDRTIFSYNPPSQPGIDNLDGNALELPEIALFDGFYIEAAIYLAGKLKANNVPVIFDGGSWKKGMEEFLPLVDIAICSHDFYPPGTSSKKDVIKYLESKDISKVAITRGDQPVLFKSPDHSGEIYVEDTEVLDTLGAGDFFHGAFCYYYASGDSFVEALRKAAEIATESCKSFGTRNWLNKEENKDEQK